MIMRAKPRKNKSWLNQARKHRVFPLFPSMLIREVNIDFSVDWVKEGE